MQNKNQMDMLHGSLIKKILIFAAPLAASSVLQQLFNAADMAVVGRFAGADALAAVGSNSPVVSLFINTFVGFSVGANVIIAQYIGNKQTEKVSDVVHTAISLSVIISVAVMILGQLLAKPLLLFMGAPGEVMDKAMLYLRIYFLGLPFISLYNFGAAILRSVGDTKRPTIVLACTGVVNIILNLMLVVGCHLGVAGVAIATVTANLLNAISVIVILNREQSVIHFDPHRLGLYRQPLIKIIKLGGPAAIQSMVFSFSNVCIQSGINELGTAVIAGSAAAVNFEFLDYFAVTAFNTAAVTFIGQNYAAGNYERCRKIICVCMAEAVIVVLTMEAIFFGGQSFILSLFTQDPEVAFYAAERMRVVLIVHFLICTYEITGSVLRGMGISLLPAVITILGSVCFRVCWLLLVFKRIGTFVSLLRVYPISWILTCTMMVTAYFVVTYRQRKARARMSA